MFAINRPIAVLMAAVALTVLGWHSLRQLETSLLPEIEYPKFVIVTKYRNGSPREIEKNITAPLEESLASLPNLQDLVSSSRDGISIIEAQFYWNIDARFTLLRIREKIDAVFDHLPRGTERPYILDFNPGSLPVMELVLYGNESLVTLGEFASDVIQPRFSQIEGIARASVIGAPQKAVQIEMDPEKCTLLGISAKDIISSVQSNLPHQPLSSIVRVGYAEYPLTVEFTVEHPSDLEHIPVQTHGTSVIRLGDVARVRVAPLPHQTLVYRDTTRTLYLQLFRESGANTVQATQASRALIKTLAREFPNIQLRVVRDQGEYVLSALRSLNQAIILGAVLAFGVILLFLRNFRYALLLSTVIPVSILFAFNALYLHNISMNVMTMGGLALGLGLIIDNGIVVVESVFTEFHRSRSLRSLETGVKKVKRAITGSTLTTIAIFIPVIYVKGYASVLFQQQALTVAYTLLISLVAALILIPALFRLVFFGTSNHGKAIDIPLYPKRIHKIARKFQLGYKSLTHLYHRLLVWALDHPGKSLLVLGLVLILGASAITVVHRQYWPSVPTRRVEIKVAVPTTTPYLTIRTGTGKTLRNFARLPFIKRTSTLVLDPLNTRAEELQDLLNSPGMHYIYFSLELDRPFLGNSSLRDSLLEQIIIPYQDVSIYQASQFGQEITTKRGKNFSVYISGERKDKIQEVARRIENYLLTLDDCRNVAVESGGTQQVKSVRVRTEALQLEQVTADDIANNLNLYTGEEIIGSWVQNLRTWPVIATWDRLEVKKLADVLNAQHDPGQSSYRNDHLMTVSDVQKIQNSRRVNRKPVVSVSASVLPHRLNTVVQSMEQWIESNPTPELSISIAGESQRMAKSFRDLLTAFVLAVIIVYLILAAQFESFIHPFTILLTVPMGLSGAMFALLIFHQSINVISLIGAVMLIGIGVNDAIIKVDYMNYLHHRLNLPLRDAVLRTSAEKLRPVLMTTLTTMAAMLPMALGLGGSSEMNQPLAITIIGGLAVTTTLTLIITPVLYETGERILEKLKKQKSKSIGFEN